MSKELQRPINAEINPGEAKANWIPSKTRKPEDQKTVLMYCEKAEEKTWLGYWDNVANRWKSLFGDNLRYAPTHWTYLPQPPQFA